MKKIVILSLTIFSSQLLFSQELTDSTYVKPTNTNTIEDPRISKLNESYISGFKLIGYRVQIYSGNKKQPANQSRSTFLRVHPKTKAHLNYKQPHFKVRVGDFRTKLEALKYKNSIIDEFPNCFIVKDEIDITELD